MSEHRKFRFGVAVHGALLAAGVAAATMVAPPAAAETTLKAVVHADLKILDPVWTTAFITNRHGYLIYDNLFGLNSKFEPQPQMVDKWTVSADKLTYTFTLRPGMKWHDGMPVTAADCVASLLRSWKREPMGQRLASFVASLDVVDASTFRLTLKEAYGLVLETLGKAATPAFMMPERIAKTDAMTQITEYVGSGPFIFVKDEWRPGNKVVYRKFADYVPRKEKADYLSGGKVAKVDRLEWLYIPDHNTALSALQAGEIDYYEAPPLDFVAVLEKNPKLQVIDIDPLGTQGVLRPNHLYPPFNNPKARQALLHIVKQEDYMRAVVGNPRLYRKFCGAYFMCGSDNESDVGAEPLRKQDFAKAKQLLKEAGYNGEKIVVMQPTDRAQYNAATMVTIQNLRKAGVNVDVQAMDWSTLLSRRAKKDPPYEGGYHIFHTTQGGPDTAMPVANTWFNSRCEKANPGWACDLELDKLVEEWSRESDRTKRKAILERIQKRAYESVPYVIYGQYTQPIAVRANVKGVLKAGIPIYWNIEKQ
ncbi:MAG: ABC transporter substrate-binding protein [Alphaproteobacteria bacterium]|nr:ABC transporter substrate-binding protein [Alphaproteobacteria bacterium]